MKNIKMYGTQQCSDCVRAKQYLASLNIDYEFVDIAQVPGAAEEIMAVNCGKQIVPTFVIDGVVYSNPNYYELKELFEIKKAS